MFLNASGNDTLLLNNFISVNALPAPPIITVSGNILMSSSAALYQWELNSVPIPGATGQSFVANQSGFYSVVITDENGCSNSAGIDFIFTGVET